MTVVCPHMVCVHWMSSGFTRNCSFLESLQITPSTADSLRYWILCSMVSHLSQSTKRSSLQRHLSLMLDRSHFQRLRVSGLFPFPSQCLHPGTGTQIAWVPWSSQVTRDSPHSSPGGRDQEIISGPASSPGCEGPASSSSLTTQTDLYWISCSVQG